MSLNAFMHPRNIYKSKPDYNKLSEKYPNFKKVLTFYKNGKPKINFKDPYSLRVLTITLLENDFHLNVDLPLNRLIPAIPQRLNYILWIEDLISLLNQPKNTQIIGIDIGTGPCCVFPLLGVSLNKNWKFFATEVDEYSINYAINNVIRNHFQNSIEVIQVTTDPIISQNVIALLSHPFHFIMCNPPFFESKFEKETEAMEVDANKNDLGSRKKKKRTPFSSNMSSANEAITEGGEVQFVMKLFQESLQLQEKVKIYTVMLGHKKSVKMLKQKLNESKAIKNLVVNEFCQGSTKRWGLAWTFDDQIKLSESIISQPIKKKKSQSLIFQIPISLKWINLKSVFDYMMKLIKEDLEISQIEMISQSSYRIEISVKSNVNNWVHQRRKNRKEKQKKTESNQDDNGMVYLMDKVRGDGGNDCVYDNRIKRKYSFNDEEMQVDDESQYSDPQDYGQINKKKREEKIIINKKGEIYLLHCNIILVQTNDLIVIEMKTKENAKSKESTYQLHQYFKNKFQF